MAAETFIRRNAIAKTGGSKRIALGDGQVHLVRPPLSHLVLIWSSSRLLHVPNMRSPLWPKSAGPAAFDAGLSIKVLVLGGSGLGLRYRYNTVHFELRLSGKRCAKRQKRGGNVPVLSVQVLRILATAQLQVAVSKPKPSGLVVAKTAAASSLQFQNLSFRSIVSESIFDRAWDASALSASASCRCSASAAFQEACNRAIRGSNLQLPRLDFLQLLLQLLYLLVQSFLAFIYEETMSRMKTTSIDFPACDASLCRRSIWL